MSTSALRLRTRDGVRAAVDTLSNGHPITRIDGGREPVWRIAPEHQHAAAFYRNSVIHAFLETSIVELALDPLPDCVAVGLDDHAALDDFGGLRHVALQNYVLIPCGEVCRASGDG